MKLRIHPDRMRHALEGLGAQGIDIRATVRAAELPVDIEEGTQMVELAHLVRLMRATQARLDDEYLGLTDRPMRCGGHGLVAAHASHGETLLEAYQRAAQVLNLMDVGIHHEVRASRHEVCHEIRVKPGRAVKNQLAQEIALLVPYSLVSWLGAHRIPISQVLVSFSPPVRAESYRLVFHGAPTILDASTTAIRFPITALRRRVQRSEAQALAWGARYPTDTFLCLPPLEGLALEVATVIEASLERGLRATMGEVASGLGIPTHTLRRRLQVEGVAFIDLRNQTKREIATRLLSATSLTIDEITERVGFGQPSAFVRAFRGWTGLTPHVYRTGNRDMDSSGPAQALSAAPS